MNYSTQIDKVAIQIDCNTTQEQRELLKSLLGFTIVSGLFVKCFLVLERIINFLAFSLRQHNKK